uniref:Uncharacterized protein n=1 Tax=Sinocyclocheilus grahami TaxID=75366 RepID=A0A672Q0X4_SINGR
MTELPFKLSYVCMVPLFSLFILFLKTSCVCSWLAVKCLFYSDMQEFPVATTCAGKTNIAECHHVTDVKEDLRGLPSNLLKLGDQMERDCHGALAPDSFSRFVSLEYLEIRCFSEILPEAFNGLTNVTSLTLSFLSLEICSLLPLNVFEMIPQLAKSLKMFKLKEYELNRLQYLNFSVFDIEELHLYLGQVSCR